MYTLVMGLWRMFFTKTQYQILILGLDDAGKTTLLEQFKCLYSGTPRPQTLKIPPTVGLNIGKLDVARSKLVFWDLGGQSGLRVLWDKYFSDAHALVYVVDSTDQKRMEESRAELEKLMSHKELVDAPLLIFANKQDIESKAIPEEQVVRLLGLHVDDHPPPTFISRPESRFSSLSSSSSTSSNHTHHISSFFPSPLSASSSTPSHSNLTTTSRKPSSIALSTLSPSSVTNAASSSLFTPSSHVTPSSSHHSASHSNYHGASITHTHTFVSHGFTTTIGNRLIRLQAISALTGKGVDDGLRWLLEVLPKCKRTKRLEAEKTAPY